MFFKINLINIFLESICNSDNIVESNVREVKVHSPDYKGKVHSPAYNGKVHCPDYIGKVHTGCTVQCTDTLIHSR